MSLQHTGLWGAAQEAVRLPTGGGRNPAVLSPALSSLDLVHKYSRKPGTVACTQSPARTGMLGPKCTDLCVFTEKPNGALRRGCRITEGLSHTCKFSVRIKLRFHVPATVGAFNSKKAN